MKRSLKLLAIPAAAVATVTVGAVVWALWSSTGTGNASTEATTLGAPEWVTATEPRAGVNDVTVAWDAVPSPAGGSTDLGYLVERLELSGTDWLAACDSSPADPMMGTTCIDEDLEDGFYQYRVTALFRSWTARGDAVSDPAVEVVNDAEPPATTATIDPSPTAGWNNTDVTVSLSAVDNPNPGGSGVASITYSASGAQTIAETTIENTSGASPFVVDLPAITTNGETTISFYATDNAGWDEPLQTKVIKIDRMAPVTTAQVTPAPNGAGWNNTNVTVTLLASDSGGSGSPSILYSTSGGTPTTPYTGPIVISAEGIRTVRFFATDAAGNAEAIQETRTIKIDTIKPTVPSPKVNGKS